ncbi:hypothetical protein Tco_0116412 [Tanacetum coccineum]
MIACHMAVLLTANDWLPGTRCQAMDPDASRRGCNDWEDLIGGSEVTWPNDWLIFDWWTLSILEKKPPFRK